MRNNNSPSDEAPLANDETQNAETRLLFDLQWYRRDTERFAQELRCLSQTYEDLFVARTDDHDLAVVVGTVMGFIALVAPYDYPLSPPRAYDLSGQVSQYYKENTVEIDLFCRTGFRWHPNNSLRDAVAAAEKALGIQIRSAREQVEP